MSNPELCIKCPDKICIPNQIDSGFIKYDKLTHKSEFIEDPTEKCLVAIALLGLKKANEPPNQNRPRAGK